VRSIEEDEKRRRKEKPDSEKLEVQKLENPQNLDVT
jgi:hypothetical protein